MYKNIIPFFLITFMLSSFKIEALAQESVRPWMGVYIEEESRGILIKKSVPDTPAFRAGLKANDVILSVDSNNMKKPNDLIQYLINKGVGNQVKLKYLEGGKLEKETLLKLEAMLGLTDMLKKQLVGKTAPSFKAKILSDNKKAEYELSNHTDKVKIIEFWATWCGACMQAHPLVNEFANKHKDKITVLAISNEEPKVLKKYLAQAKKAKFISSDVIYLQGHKTNISENYPIPALPTFLVLDQKNNVNEIYVGVGDNLNATFEKALQLSSK